MTSEIIAKHCQKVNRILIIEDMASLAEFLKVTIERENEIPCDIAFNEASAKKLIEQNEYQLVLVDIYLPDSTGNFIGFLIRHNMQIFIMTGTSNEDERAKLIKLPIVDYISKTDKETLTRYITCTIKRLEKNRNSLVVVCDDSKTSRRYITNILVNQNIQFIEFEDGKEAYEYIMENGLKVGLLISDFEMPYMDGLELTRKLRLKYSPLELPILIQSGRSGESDIANMLKIGANEYVSKPLANEEFLARVNALLDHSRIYAENKKLAKKLHAVAMQDYLTGLYNRNYFNINIEQVLAQTRRNKNSYAIIVLDIDDFKKINDEYGHCVGDTVLKEVARVLKNLARPTDIVCRWGGEEFIILMPNTDSKGSRRLAERICTQIDNLSIKVLTLDTALHTTISAGIADGDTEDIDGVIKKADERMYKAKANGKNQVISN